MLPDLVVYLLGKGAHQEGVKLTTKEMAGELGVSQQTISRWMIELEQGGYIDRKEGDIRLTQKAVAEADKVYQELKIALECTRKFKFAGSVVDGLGTGGNFLKISGYREGITKKIGFKPFAGTLNVKIPADQIDLRLSLRSTKPITIGGFESGGRRYGPIAAYKATIFGEPAAVLFPEMSQHGLEMLEIISPDNLRGRYGLKNGQAVEIIVSSGN